MSLLPSQGLIELMHVTEIRIHDTVFYDLFYRELPDGLKEGPMRVNVEAFYENPQVGDTVEVQWVLGSVMGARKVEAASNS